MNKILKASLKAVAMAAGTYALNEMLSAERKNKNTFEAEFKEVKPKRKQTKKPTLDDAFAELEGFMKANCRKA